MVYQVDFELESFERWDRPAIAVRHATLFGPKKRKEGKALVWRNRGSTLIPIGEAILTVKSVKSVGHAPSNELGIIDVERLPRKVIVGKIVERTYILSERPTVDREKASQNNENG